MNQADGNSGAWGSLEEGFPISSDNRVIFEDVRNMIKLPGRHSEMSLSICINVKYTLMANSSRRCASRGAPVVVGPPSKSNQKCCLRRPSHRL